MLIIPVIDLYAGNVVHAVEGHRETYRNIQTPLCHGSDPLVVVEALLGLYPFTTLYVADLDAIKDTGNNNNVINELLVQYPDICIWLDSAKSVYPTSLSQSRFRQIIATETGISEQDLREHSSGMDAILSLDFSARGFIGQQTVLENPSVWPGEIIVMSMNRVGMNQGPDIARLTQIQSFAGNSRIYAAGGIRDDDDLARLDEQNISGVLLATALHQGRISAEALSRYSSI